MMSRNCGGPQGAIIPEQDSPRYKLKASACKCRGKLGHAYWPAQRMLAAYLSGAEPA